MQILMAVLAAALVAMGAIAAVGRMLALWEATATFASIRRNGGIVTDAYKRDVWLDAGFRILHGFVSVLVGILIFFGL